MRRKLINSLAVRCCCLLFALGMAGCAGSAQDKEAATAAAFSDMRSAVTQTVADPVRAAAASELVTEMEIELKALLATQKSFEDRLRVLNRDYDATREQFDELLSEAEVAIEKHHNAVLRINRTMLSNMTAEEWQALAKERSRAVNKLLKQGTFGGKS